MAGRAGTGFANADADTRQGQLQIRAGQAAQRRHARPDNHRDGNNIAARIAVGQNGNGNAQSGIKNRKAEADEETQLGIRQHELQFNAFRQYGHNLPVDMAGSVNRHQHGQCVIAGFIGNDRTAVRLCAHNASPIGKTIGQKRGFGELEIIGKAEANGIFIGQSGGECVFFAIIILTDLILKARFQYGLETASEAAFGLQ